VFLFSLGVHACLLGVGSRFFVGHAYDVCVDKVEWFVHAQWDVVVTWFGCVPWPTRPGSHTGCGRPNSVRRPIRGLAVPSIPSMRTIRNTMKAQQCALVPVLRVCGQ